MLGCEQFHLDSNSYQRFSNPGTELLLFPFTRVLETMFSASWMTRSNINWTLGRPDQPVRQMRPQISGIWSIKIIVGP